MKKKSKKSIDQKQLLILIGCILIAVLVLILTPAELPGKDAGMNELEMHDEMSQVADDYMLASNEQERQEAASRMRSVRAGNTSGTTANALNPMSVLRGIIFLAIVVLAYRIFILVFPGFRLTKATQV